jgi:hypothetical protein
MLRDERTRLRRRKHERPDGLEGYPGRKTLTRLHCPTNPMDNPSMDKLERSAYRPGIKTSQCCKADVAIMYDGERTFYLCVGCRNECDVWQNRQEW